MLSVRTISGLFASLALITSIATIPADARTRHHRAPVARSANHDGNYRAPAARVVNYDGNWSVLIVTSSGPCDRGYRYGVTIRGGRVAYEGGAPVNVDGAVSGNGSVQVRLSAGSQSASGAGHLGRDSGGGTWRGVSSSGSCAGTWTAERRG
jgi:hypothetical protein